MRKQVFTTEKLHVNVLYIPEEYLSVHSAHILGSKKANIVMTYESKVRI